MLGTDFLETLARVRDALGRRIRLVVVTTGDECTQLIAGHRIDVGESFAHALLLQSPQGT